MQVTRETRFLVTTRPFSNQTLSFPEVWIVARWRHIRDAQWGPFVCVTRSASTEIATGGAVWKTRLFVNLCADVISTMLVLHSMFHTISEKVGF